MNWLNELTRAMRLEAVYRMLRELQVPYAIPRKRIADYERHWQYNAIYHNWTALRINLNLS